VTEWETAPAVAETPEIKLFGKWSTDDVQINDISLQVGIKRSLFRQTQRHYIPDYIAVKEKYAKYLPHSGGRYAAKRFRKAQCPIVERLTNSMMMHGRNNGKKLMTVRIVKHAFEIIHLLTGEVRSFFKLDSGPLFIVCTGKQKTNVFPSLCRKKKYSQRRCRDIPLQVCAAGSLV
uniref:Ribosomal protein S5 n=1 Tax=Cyprinodon variegatus TaxID=28743 RepID=A0A3Q2EK62_CYPVA